MMQQVNGLDCVKHGELRSSFRLKYQEVAALGEDGAQIMIKHGWLEQPPQAADRKELALNR